MTHTDRIEAAVEMWQLLRDYVNHKDRADAAEHVIALLTDWGFEKRELAQVANMDPELAEAWEQVDEDSDDSDESEWTD